MAASRQIIAGILVSLVILAVLEFMPDGEVAIMIGGTLLLLIALVRGRR